jgi:hypothetical protein
LGQISLSAMRDLYRVQAIDQRTAFIALLASDADVLPALTEGNHWLGHASHNAVLVPLSLALDEDAEAALASVQPTAALLGCIVPTPTTFVILSGPARQPALARDASEESPLPYDQDVRWRHRTEAVNIIDALRRLLDDGPGAWPDG